MAQIKQRRLPEIDYPSGRGAGGITAAGTHVVDRELGATPINFRFRDFSGQPSTSADSGFSRAIQRVNSGYEAQKALEDIPEISWLKSHAEQLSAMGLTPRTVVETYMTLVKYKPQSEDERRVIAEMVHRVAGTRRQIRMVTRLALLESVSKDRRRIDEGVLDYLKSKASELTDDAIDSLTNPSNTSEDDAREKAEEEEREGVQSALKAGQRSSTGSISRSDVEEMLDQDDVTAGVLSCNSRSLEILQTVLAVTGVFGDLAIFLGLPVGMAADIVNSCINLVCGHYFHAMLDAVAVLPFAGDLAKIFYAKRLLKTLGISSEAKFLKGIGSISDQAKEAGEVIDMLLRDKMIGPRMSKTILGLKKSFGTAERLAEHINELLLKSVTRMIAFFEDVKAGASSGKIAKKGAAWILSKLPIDLLDVLKRIQADGIPALKEFIVELFGRKGVQKTASTMQVKQSVLEPLAAEDRVQPTISAPVTADDFDPDPDGDGVPGPFYGGNEFDDYSRQSGIMSAGLYESKKGRRKKSIKKLSLAKALDGDDSVVDEMSTDAGSLGSPGEPGAGGYVIPLGMKPSGAARKGLDDLVPGYNFAKGSSMYYKH